MIEVLLTGALAPAASWRQGNHELPHASIRQLIVHPTTGDTYAVTAAGIFKSADGAQSWTPITTISGVLTLDPDHPFTLYILQGQILLKSNDGGTTWANAGPPGQPLGFFAIHPEDSTLHVTAFDSRGRAVIFRSADAGASWDAMNPGVPIGLGFCGPPVSVPGNPARIYVPYSGCAASSAGISFVAGIATTVNQGRTWQTSLIPAVSGISSLVVDPSQESVIYAAVSYSVSGFDLLKSTDAGKSWSALQTGLPPTVSYGALVIDAAAPSTIYAPYAGFGCGGCGGIIKTTDGGAHWTILTSGLTSGGNYTLALDPVAPSTLYVGTSASSGGMIKSVDGGATWSAAVSPAVPVFDVSALAVNPVNPAILYASSGEIIFQSVDHGEHWAQLAAFQLPAKYPDLPGLCAGAIPGAAAARALAVDAIHPSILYARAVRPGGCYYLDRTLFKSTDAGASWTDDITPPQSGCTLADSWDPAWMAMDPTDPATIYLGESWEGGTAVIKTSDGGATWQNIWPYWTDDFPDAVHALVIDPSRHNTLYAGLSGSGVFKSDDGGATWSSTGLTGPGISAMAIDSNHPSVLYAAGEGAYPQPRGFHGVFKSADGGANWSEISLGLEGLFQTSYIVTAIVIDASASQTVYLATSGAGIFRTIDGGANWTGFNEGLASLDVRVLALASGTLYAGTSGGVFTIDPAMPE